MTIAYILIGDEQKPPQESFGDALVHWYWYAAELDDNEMRLEVEDLAQFYDEIRGCGGAVLKSQNDCKKAKAQVKMEVKVEAQIDERKMN